MTKILGDINKILGKMTKILGDMTKILGKITKLLGNMTQPLADMTSRWPDQSILTTLQAASCNSNQGKLLKLRQDEPFGLSANFTIEQAKIFFISPVERTSIENTSNPKYA